VAVVFGPPGGGNGVGDGQTSTVSASALFMNQVNVYYPPKIDYRTRSRRSLKEY